jgi:hypothetical protein
MKLNPTQYMLELDKGGDKLPSMFDVRTIMEQPLGNTPQTSFTPSFPNIDQTFVLSSLSYLPSQPMTTNNSSLFQALQNNPLVNTQNLEENIVLGISNNNIPQDALHPFTPLTFNNTTVGSTF